MALAKQYEVWEACKGKPRRIAAEAAIGMRRVKIQGVWHDRNDGGLFDTEADCQAWIDESRRNKKATATAVDPMFIPTISE